MKEKIILMLKGFVLGIANIIPGVSGGTLAITLGIYEDLIKAISHFFQNFKKNLNFVIPIIIGAGLSILLVSKLVNYALEYYPIPTTLFFIGLIVGGIPLIYKKVSDKKVNIKNVISFLIPFILILMMSFMKGENVVRIDSVNIFITFILFIVGMVAAATMVIPGISGSFVLMLIGFYKPVLKVISGITDFSKIVYNLSVLIPFGIGIVVGIVLVAKLIEYLLSKHEVLTYYAILGFITSSVISLVIGLSSYSVSVVNILLGVVLFVLGTVIGYKLGDE